MSIEFMEEDEVSEPCNCPMCKEAVDLQAMKPVRDGRRKFLVCPDCWDQVQQEE